MNSKEKNSPDQITVRMQDCISASNLSAELDGEYHFSPDEKAHLEHLPTNLEEALAALEEDHDYLLEGNVFPQELLKNWMKMLRKDLSEINSKPHPVEFKLYYDL